MVPEIFFGIVAFILISKYRDDICGWVADNIEPHNGDEELPNMYVSIDADKDYRNLKYFIQNSKDQKELDAAFQLIIIYQEDYSGVIAQQRVSELIELLEARRRNQVALLN